MTKLQDIQYSDYRKENMKRCESAPQVVTMFTTDEVGELMDMRENYERVEKLVGVVNYKYKTGSELELLLKDRLEPILGKYIRHGGNYFSTPNPFHVHTDTGKTSELADNMIPYKNVVVPLLDTPHGAFSTVIFKQRHYGEAAHFWKGSIFKYKEPVYNHKITDYEGIEGYTDEPFNVDDYVKYLSHLPYENLHGLSIETVIEWKIGDVLIFDCSSIHASSNFSLYAPRKEGISLFVSREV